MRRCPEGSTVQIKDHCRNDPNPHFILFETWSINNIYDKSSKKEPTYSIQNTYKVFYKVACICHFGQNWESNFKRLKFEIWGKQIFFKIVDVFFLNVPFCNWTLNPLKSQQLNIPSLHRIIRTDVRVLRSILRIYRYTF